MGFGRGGRQAGGMSRIGFDRRAAAEALHAVIGLPLAVLGMGYLFPSLWAGARLVVTFIGLPVIVLALAGARRLAGLDRYLARRLLRVQVETPSPLQRQPGLFNWLRTGLTDPAGWRSVLFLLLSVPGRLAATMTAGVFWVEGAALLAYPLLWWIGDPVNVDAQGRRHHSGLQFGDFFFDTWPKAFLVSLLGCVALLVAPWAVRLALLPERLLVR